MFWANLLGILLCAQVFLFGSRELVTAGLVQYSVAGVLLGWSAMAAVTRRNLPANSETWVVQLMRVPRASETLLMTAYICAAASWLNVLAAHPDGRFCTTASALTGTLCTVLFFRLARYQDATTGVLKDTKGRKRVRAAVAWVVLMICFALPLVGGVAATEIRNPGPPVTSELTAPALILVWLCFCSVFFAAVLFRPQMMKLSSIALPALIALVGVLGVSAALEELWRRSWYLYTLTSLTFVGTALGVWRLLGSLHSASPGLSHISPSSGGSVVNPPRG